MRWPQVGVIILAVMAIIGCPSEFGREGRIAKAVRQDALELVRRRCDAKELWEACKGPNKDPVQCQKCDG
jgi:hypothetical protein